MMDNQMPTSDMYSSLIDGIDNFQPSFHRIVASDPWKQLQKDFNRSTRILLVGNGGNLAVCDHGAIDIARLTNKSATAPGSGILASSLINDANHDQWVKNWFKIATRGLDSKHISETLLIGISSSGKSFNICQALSCALEFGASACLISAVQPKIKGEYNTVIMDIGEYHTSEILALALVYQLIHGSGFKCPPIQASLNTPTIDYNNTEHVSGASF